VSRRPRRRAVVGPGNAGAMPGVSWALRDGGEAGRVLKGSGQRWWLGDGVEPSEGA